MKMNFYKENNRWYANIPDVDQDLCEMVMGADIMLDILSNYTQHISLLLEPNVSDANLLKVNEGDAEGESGCYYVFTEYNGKEYYFEIWLCNVTKHVFGEFPDKIKIRKV